MFRDILESGWHHHHHQHQRDRSSPFKNMQININKVSYGSLIARLPTAAVALQCVVISINTHLAAVGYLFFPCRTLVAKLFDVWPTDVENSKSELNKHPFSKTFFLEQICISSFQRRRGECLSCSRKKSSKIIPLYIHFFHKNLWNKQ